MGNEINELEKKMNSEKANSIPARIPFDVNEELDRFLSKENLQDKIKCVKKAYKNKRFKDGKLFLIYAAVLAISMIIYKINLLKIGNHSRSFVMMLILFIGYAVLIFYHLKFRRQLNTEFANEARKLSDTVQAILKQGSFNAEYLEFILTQRIKERKSLDLQFSTMIKMINAALNFTAIFGMILWLILSFFQLGEHNVLISYAVSAIIAVIIIGVVIDFLNYNFSDAYYCSYEILLEAVVKYKIEEKKPQKTEAKII